MYPLLDTTTMNRRAADGRRAAAAARRARSAKGQTAPEQGHSAPRGVRHALGASLVRAGVRLINA